MPDLGYEAFRVTGFIRPETRGFASVDCIDAPWEAYTEKVTDAGDLTFEKGKLTRLHVRHVMVMSDGYREYVEHRTAIDAARGRVLVNGLGLGCYLKAILAKPGVEHVDVVEISKDVCELVGPYYTQDPRVCLINADAYEQAKLWPRGTWWDCVWSDVWPTVSVDDLADHARLLRSYGRRAGWQGAWIHEELQRKKRAGYESMDGFAARMKALYGVDVHIGYIPEWAG